MQQGARGTEAFLDLSIMTLHVSAEGGMTLLAAVLGHPEHLEFLMNTVALQALEQQEKPVLKTRFASFSYRVLSNLVSSLVVPT